MKTIIDIISKDVKLKKKGKRYVGLCPFHEEKTPSFSVSQEKGLFYCFGCHAGGDAAAFIMQTMGVDLATAREVLAGAQS